MDLLPTDLVLVAILSHQRDLDIARLLGWYRIPLRSAPKTIAVDWLAFYQTAAFGADKWAINYAAPVRGYELQTRVELLHSEPDHPRANEPYYRIQLGTLERLPHPIPARHWRRLTFLYATGELLLSAQEIGDLIVPSGERERLWRALCERHSEGLSHYGANADPELPPEVRSVLRQLLLLPTPTTDHPEATSS